MFARQVSNATVDVSTFTPGTTGQVVVRITRIDGTQRAHATLFETNTAGVNHHCDPSV